MIIDNQFRPTPQSKLLPPVLDAIEAAGKPAVIVCANGKVFPMSDSDIDQKIGKDNLARMERLGIEFHQNDPRNADNYSTSASRLAARRSGCTRRSPRVT